MMKNRIQNLFETKKENILSLYFTAGFPNFNDTFTILKHLSVDITQKNIDNVCMDILSMGMTGDYEVALEEGATYVRVGTGIFGERNYTVSK